MDKNTIKGTLHLLLLALGLTFFAEPTIAQETQPGDACAGVEAGYFRQAQSNPMTDGGNFMICDGANWVGFLHYSSSGNVGIGVTNPDVELDVVGDTDIDGSLYLTNSLLSGDTNVLVDLTDSTHTHQIYVNGGNADIGIGTASSAAPGSKADIDMFRARGSIGSETAVVSGDSIGALRFSGYDGTNFEGQAEIVAVVDGAVSNNIVPTALSFRTSDDANPAYLSERMLITSGGLVGIGDTTPDVELDVVGDINYTGVIVDVSDIRMKYDITPLESPLKKLTALNGIAFKMKGDERETIEYGVSAQDVQKAFPELVHQIDEDGTLGVSYNGLIAPMIEAIKELKAENEMLKTRLIALEQRD
ncbi:MAG: tail fiber domain-containing protein [Candidatus Thiodiazotropha sp. (ex Troendleina suluensis)]|nr:tail fiber domain-containing protein [Candidatus Thiodiazotropha sp. (ex Troendleina suluensis)]